MIDRLMLYDVIYALASIDGREDVLFGTCAPLAREAFLRSVPCDAFPELWFEIPLAGDPWFDLHALTARETLHPDMTFAPETCGGYPEAFAWFASQGYGARQLALSWDVSSGDISSPAIQLLLRKNNPSMTCDFLASVGRADAAPAYRTFHDRIPVEWFACYTGVFPARPDLNLRVECVPNSDMQRAYANDAELIEKHLRQTGLEEIGETIIPRCQALADTPFQFEFQFDVNPDGSAGPTVGASARFASPSGKDDWEMYDINGSAGELMRQVEAWGLSDGRWRDMAGTLFSKRLSRGGESAHLYCYPAFLKLRWRNGEPLDAKAYLIAGLQLPN